MWDNNLNDAKYYTSNSRSGFCKNGGGFSKTKNRLPTILEKNWLLAMIKEDKFIPLNKLKYNNIYELW